MKVKILWSVFLAGASCLMSIGAVQAAGDPEAGRIKFFTCKGCHSTPGYTNTYPTYHVPKVGGQHAEYVVAALQAYQKGERKHGSMLANTSNLSVQDMEDLAAYIARFKFLNPGVPVSGDVEAGKALSGSCAACHGEDGNSLNPMYPRLAGQYEDYLVKSLQDYKSGARSNALMQGLVQNLSEKDMRDLAAFYASQQKGLIVIKEKD